MNYKCVHIFVTGKVQGVFFRQATRVIAIKNHVTGWVENLDDGRVEIMIEGEDKSVDAVTKWCSLGLQIHVLMILKLIKRSFLMNLKILKLDISGYL